MIPVSKNEEYELKIENVSSDGNGVGHIKGFAVFVPDTCGGDVVKVRIVSVKNRFAYGEAVEIIESSPDRVNAGCVHNSVCGGCQLQHMKYSAQLNVKRNTVENSIKRLGGFDGFKLDEIIGMDEPQRYRNKVIFHFGYGKKHPVCGFYAQKSHNVFEINDCILCNKIFTDIAKAILKFASDFNVSIYNEKTHKGIIRRVFIRKSFQNGGIMVALSVNSKTLPHQKQLVDTLRSVSEDVKSVYLNIDMRKNSTSPSFENVLIYGEEKLTDSINGVKFEISPQSFFQVNPLQTEKLYAKAIEYADISPDDTVMDIYCGIGTISLCAAKYAKRVVGVEVVKEAIEDAKRNAELNGIENAEFFAEKAENIVPKLIESGENPDIVILDPPRAGSDEETLNAIVNAQPKRIVYVSCNSATLARDMRFLNDNGYGILKSTAVDMFPNTNHIECVVLMSRVDTDK